MTKISVLEAKSLYNLGHLRRDASDSCKLQLSQSSWKGAAVSSSLHLAEQR